MCGIGAGSVRGRCVGVVVVVTRESALRVEVRIVEPDAHEASGGQLSQQVDEQHQQPTAIRHHRTLACHHQPTPTNTHNHTHATPRHHTSPHITASRPHESSDTGQTPNTHRQRKRGTDKEREAQTDSRHRQQTTDNRKETPDSRQQTHTKERETGQTQSQRSRTKDNETREADT